VATNLVRNDSIFMALSSMCWKPTSDLNDILAPVIDSTYNRRGRVARCHQDTRNELIAVIKRWVGKGDDQPICWLNGPAGAGKSAVSQTFAEWCATKNILAASFFFSRGAGNRSKMARFVPSLAHHLSTSIPATKPSIERVLHHEPSIFQSAYRHQLQRLLIEPILAVRNPILATLAMYKPMVIVIDALDECDDKDLVGDFIESVTMMFEAKPRLPIRFFFTSRIEEHLRQKLHAPTIYTLGLQDFDARDDIRKYFRSQLSAIHKENRTMRNIPLPWPSDPDLEDLVRLADGSFIFASTLCNFINDGTDYPYRKIRDALGAGASLDALYTQVLSAAPPGDNFQRVIGTIMLLKAPLSITSLGYLLNLENADILQPLLGIQSIILIPGDDSKLVTVFHTSLRDFLMTQPRSRTFFIDPPTRHLSIATDCLAVLKKQPERDIVYNGTQAYACLNWYHHFHSGLAEGEGDYVNSLLGTSISYLADFSQSLDFCINTLIYKDAIRDFLDALHLVSLMLKVSLEFYPFWVWEVSDNLLAISKLPTASLTDL
jgi:hypothetical protein